MRVRKTVFLFVGKKKDLQAKLAAMTGQNVIYLQHCELCGRLCAGDICRQCEPVFLNCKRAGGRQRLSTQTAVPLKNIEEVRHANPI